MKHFPAPFTVEEGIAIQTEQVARWKTILNAWACAALDAKITEENNSLTDRHTGAEVFRGCDIDTFLMNLQRGKYRTRTYLDGDKDEADAPAGMVREFFG